ncbi:uncharacterized protein C8orf76 homolog isoform X2 [Eptesicus fuscus]|uniref:uncharacterized protein C8orf76 homolog isoform X2 n=1 Tax=Eptesicus fuscus TaxID=29078 RepID=UPI0024041D47|nr:uncharacterized protein C8orf76 homolog isoform X2 [Eptesicus fuscus]
MEAGCWLLGGEFEDSVFEERRERRPGPPASYRAKLCEPQLSTLRTPTGLACTDCSRASAPPQIQPPPTAQTLAWSAPDGDVLHPPTSLPSWFYGETESSDDVEALTVKKFRGDLAYRRQEYQKALQEYSSISDKLPPTNVAMKRDVQEGQARCLAHLGRHAEALAIATNLEMKATNTDHLTTVLCLQLAICSSSQDVQRTAFCLQRLVSLHPFSPWSWGRLAEAYLAASSASSHRQNRSPPSDRTVTSACPHAGRDCRVCLPETLPESSVFSVETSSSNSRKKEEALKNSRDSLSLEARVKACASFIRTRLLLQLTQSQQTSFALERNLRTQQEIEDKMKGFGFKEDTLQLITEFRCHMSTSATVRSGKDETGNTG